MRNLFNFINFKVDFVYLVKSIIGAQFSFFSSSFILHTNNLYLRFVTQFHLIDFTTNLKFRYFYQTHLSQYKKPQISNFSNFRLYLLLGLSVVTIQFWFIYYAPTLLWTIQVDQSCFRSSWDPWSLFLFLDPHSLFYNFDF